MGESAREAYHRRQANAATTALAIKPATNEERKRQEDELAADPVLKDLTAKMRERLDELGARGERR